MATCELRRQLADEMVKKQLEPPRGPGVPMHDNPHFPAEPESLFKHRNQIRGIRLRLLKASTLRRASARRVQSTASETCR